ncbi:hypothetical protein ZHAS_00017650 [Anopheles sinensis]|uniref:Uncharacterized protein n=1 Tax=Anopheles sinensis TaxID=74873 RepID=A0A084WHD9_ANOSI|nr:hypothetical protein ZHAS_00017650 [Anopheles sinensis]
MMRRETVLRLGCALLIFVGAVEAHGHGQGSVETLLAHDLSSHEGPGDNFNNAFRAMENDIMKTTFIAGYIS